MCAQSFLGKYYKYGRHGNEIDYELAVEWYYKAAVQGDKSAAFALASSYVHGEGVDRDLRLARKWYDRAGPMRRPFIRAAEIRLGALRQEITRDDIPGLDEPFA